MGSASVLFSALIWVVVRWFTHQVAVGMWADFSLKDLGEPFRMWYIYADYSKKQTKEHERLLKLHRRYKNRRKTHIILKAWKHLVRVNFSRTRVI